MKDTKYFKKKDVEQLESLVQVEDLLNEIGYRTDTIQRSPDKWKCFCPIHKENVFRSLTINISKRTFRCSFTQCPGYGGGSLLDLYSLATGKGEVATVEHWAKRLKVKTPPMQKPEDEDESEGTIPESMEVPEPLESLEEDLFEYHDADVEELIDTQFQEEPEPEQTAETSVAIEEIAEVEEEPVSTSEESEDEDEDEFLYDIDELTAVQQQQSETATAEPPDPAAATQPVAVEEAESLEHLVLRANQMIAEGRLEEAEEVLQKGLGQEPGNTDLLHCQARIYESKGLIERAVDTLVQLIDISRQRQHLEGMLTAGHRLLEVQSKNLQAHDALIEAYSNRHENEQAVRYLFDSAGVCMQSEQVDQALARLDRVLDLSPGESRALESKIQILAGVGRTSEAVDVQIELARLFLRKELIGKATTALEKAIEIEPQCQKAYRELADLYLARGMQQQAVGQMQKLAELHLSSEQMPEAIEVYKQILNLEPKHAEARNRLALLYKHSDQIDLAIEQYLQIASIYREKEMYGRAVRVYESIIRMAPERVEARRRLVEVLIEKGDENAAVEALIGLADHLSQTEDENATLAVLNQARDLAPHQENVLRRLIDLYSKLGQQEKVLEEYSNLLEVLSEVDDAERLRACCQEVLEIDPAHSQAKNLLDKLDRPTTRMFMPGEPGAVKALTAEAQRLSEEGKVEEAIECLRSAVSIEADNLQLWHDLIDLCLESGREDEATEAAVGLSDRLSEQKRLQEAMQSVERMIERLPDCVPLLERRARLEISLGAKEKALLSFQQVVQLSPENADNWLSLARLAQDQNREQQALEAFCRAAECFESEKRTAEQAECLREAVLLVPENTELRLQLASTLEHLGASEEAASQFVQAATIMQSSNETQQALSLLEQAVESFPEDLPTLEAWFSAVSKEPKRLSEQIDRALTLANLYQSQGLAGKAVQHVEKLRSLLPDNLELYRPQIDLYRDTGAVGKAIAHLLQLGRILEEREDYEKALQCYEEADSLSADNEDCLLKQLSVYRKTKQNERQFQILYRLAEIAAQRGLVGKQIQYLQSAWDLSPARIETGEQLVEIYVAKGDETQATRALHRLAEQYQKQKDRNSVLNCHRRVLEIYPEDVTTRLQLARELIEENRKEEATEHLRQIVQPYTEGRVPEDPSLKQTVEEAYSLLVQVGAQAGDLKGLGDYYATIGDKEKASEAYTNALEQCEQDDTRLAIDICRNLIQTSPQQPGVEKKLVDLYLELGQDRQAAEMLNKAWKNHYGAWQQATENGKGDTKALTNRVRQTAELLLELEPENETLLTRMADFFLAEGEPERSIDHFIRLGEIYLERGDKSGAAKVFRRIIQLRPELVEVHVRLAEVLESQGRAKDATEEYLRIGQGYFHQNDYEQAVNAFERVLQLDPENLVALQNLLEISQEQKDEKQAGQFLLRLAELEPDGRTRYQDYLKKHPDDVAVREKYLESLLEDKEVEAALEQLEILAAPYLESDMVEEMPGYFQQVKETFPDRIALYQVSARLIEKQLTTAVDKKLPSAHIDRLTQALNEDRISCAELHNSQGDKKNAARLLERVVESDPEHEKAQRLLIEIYLSENQEKKAAALWHRLASLAMRGGRLEEAHQLLRKAVELNPDSQEYKQELASLDAERGSVEEAITAHLQVARQAAAEKDDEAVLKALEEVVRYRPEDEESLKQLVDLYRKLGQGAKAIHCAEMLIGICERRMDPDGVLKWSAFVEEIEPDRPDILQKQCDALLRTQKWEQAAECLWKQSQIFRQQNQTDRELSVCTQIVDLDIARTDLIQKAVGRLVELGDEKRAQAAMLQFAERSQQREDIRTAIESYRYLVQRTPGEPRYREALAECLQKSGQVSEALQERLDLHSVYREAKRPVEMVANLQAAMEISPEDFQVRRQLGELLAELGNYTDSIQHLMKAAELARRTNDRLSAAHCYRTVLKMDPRNLEAHRAFDALQSGCALSDKEKQELLAVRRSMLGLLVETGPEALQEIDRLSETLQADCPDDETVLRSLAESYSSLKPQKSIEFRLKLLERRLRRKDTQNATAELEVIRSTQHLELGVLKQLVDLTQGTVLEESVDRERERLAQLYSDAQDHEGAVGQYEALIALRPERIEYYQALIEQLDLCGLHSRSLNEKIKLAQLHREKGNLHEAIRVARAALEFERDDFACLDFLADLSIEAGDREQARTIFERKAALSEEKGDLRQAEQDYLKLQSLFPEDANILASLSRIYRLQDRNEEAEEKLLAAADLFSQQDKVVQAIDLYQSYLQKNPQREDIIARLAETLWAAGRLSESVDREKEFIEICLKTDRQERALEGCRRLLKRDPQNLSHIYFLSQIQQRLDLTDAAVETLFELSCKYRQREMLRKSEQLLREVLTLKAEYLPAHRQLAEIHLEKGQEDECQNDLLQLIAGLLAKEEVEEEDIEEIHEQGQRILQLDRENIDAIKSLEQLTAKAIEQPEDKWKQTSFRHRLQQMRVEANVVLTENYLSRRAVEQAESCIEYIASHSAEHPRLDDLRQQLERLRTHLIPQHQFEENLKKAQKHWEMGEYSAAAELLEQLHRFQPNNVDLLVRFAEVLNRLDQTPRSINLLEQGGRAMIAEHRIDNARRCFQELSNIASDHPITHKCLAELALAEGSPQAAIEHYIHMADLALSETSRESGEEQRELVLQGLEEAREIDPGNEEVLRRLANTCRAQGQNERAIERFCELAQCCRERNSLEGAALALQEALSIESDSAGNREMFIEPGAEPPALLGVLDSSGIQKQQSLTHVQLHLDLGEVLIQSGKIPIGLEHFLSGASIALRIGQFDKARQGFERVLEFTGHQLEPFLFVRAYQGLATAYELWGRPAEAADILSKLATDHVSRGETDEAIVSLQRAHALVPENRQHLESLTQAYRAANREEDFIRSSLNLAQLLVNLDLIGKAETIYKELCDLPRYAISERTAEKGSEGEADLNIAPEQGDPCYLEVVVPLINLYLDKGATADASRYLFDLACRYLAVNEPERGIERLQRVLDLEPDHQQALERLSEVYLHQDRQVEAQEILIRLAALYERRGYAQKALETLLKILSIDPEHTTSSESVLRLTRLTGQPEQSLVAIREEFETAFERGQPAIVRTFGKLIIELQPDCLEERIRLADSYLWEALPAEAIKYLEEQAEEFSVRQQWHRAENVLRRAVEIDPDNEGLAEHLARVQEKITLLNESQRIDELTRKAEELLEGPHPEKALEEIDRLVAVSASNRSNLLWAAQIFELAAQGKPPFTAEAPTQQRQRWLERSNELRIQVASQLRNEGKFDQAENQLDLVLLVSPDHRQAASQLMEMLEQSGQKERMVERGLHLARSYSSREKWRETIDLCLWLLQRAQGHTAVLGQLAEAQAQLNLHDEAVETWYKQAEAFLKKEHFAQALSAYNKVLDILPEDPRTLRAIADVYVQRGDIRGAQSYFVRVLDAHLARDDENAASAILEKMIKLEPGQPSLHKRAVELYRRQGRTELLLHELQTLAAIYQDQEMINSAIEVWEEMIQTDPRNRRIGLQLVEGYLERGQQEEAAFEYLRMASVFRLEDEPFAVDCLRQAVDLAPDTPEVLRPYVDYLMQKGLHDECRQRLSKLTDLLEQKTNLVAATQALEQATALFPEDTEFAERLARIYQKTNRKEQATSVRETLVELYARQKQNKQAAATGLLLADYYMQTGQGPLPDRALLRKALECLKRIRKLQPENPEIHERMVEVLPQVAPKDETRKEFLWLSDYYRNKGDVARARQWLEKLLEIQGEDLEVRILLANLLQDAGDTASAVEALANIANQYREEGQVEQALGVLQRAIELEPSRTEFRQQLIDLHELSGTRRKGLEERFSLVETLLSQGKTQEAKQECQHLYDIAREQPEHLEALGKLCQRVGSLALAYTVFLEAGHQANSSGQQEKALAFFEQAQQVSPDEETPHELLCELYLNRRETEEAIGQLRALADLYRRRKSLAKLSATLKRLLEIDDNDIPAREELIECLLRQADTEGLMEQRRRLAAVYHSQQRYDEAIRQYQLMLEKDPFNLRLIDEAGQLLVESDHKQEAIGFLLEQARSLDLQGARPEAEKLLLQVHQLDPNCLEATEHLADLYRRMKRVKAAIEQLENLSSNYRQKEQFEEAIRHQRVILELDPERTDAAVRLASLLREQNQDSQAAEVLIATARRQNENGHTEAAVDIIRPALESFDHTIELRKVLLDLLCHAQKWSEASLESQALAEQLEREGEYEQAADVLNRVIEFAPESESLLLHRSRLDKETGNIQRYLQGLRQLAAVFIQKEAWESAQEYLSRIAQESPEDVDALSRLSDCQIKQERTEEASQTLRTLGSIYLKQNMPIEATSVFEKLIELVPDDEDSRGMLIEALIQSERFSEAAEHLSNLAKSLFAHRKPAEALDALARACELSPEQTGLRRTYADKLFDAGRSEEAYQQYLALASTYLNNDLAERAIEVLREAQDKWPSNTELSSQLANLYAQEGMQRSAAQQLLQVANAQLEQEETAAACDTLLNLLDIEPGLIEGRIRLADALSQLDRLEEASVEFLKIAREWIEQGELEEAARSLDQATALPEDYLQEKTQLQEEVRHRQRRSSMQSRLSQAEELEEQEKWEQASQTYRTILEDYPGSIQSLFGLARVSHRKGEAEESQTLFLEAADRYRNEGQLSQSSAALQEALSLWPNFEPALERLASIEESLGHAQQAADYYLQIAEKHEQQGRLDLAISLCEKAIGIQREQTGARQRLARLLSNLGRDQEAYQQLLAVGDQLIEQKQYEQAAEVLGQGAELLPEDARCRMKRAYCFAQLGRGEEATSENLQAAEILDSGGHRQDAMQLLGRMLEEQPEHIACHQLAIRFAENAQDRETALNHRKQLASVYSKKNMPGRAIQVYKEVLDSQPDDIVSRRQLADILDREGQSAEAAEQRLIVGDHYSRRGVTSKAVEFYRAAQTGLLEPEIAIEKIADVYFRENMPDKAVAELLTVAEDMQKKEQFEKAAEYYRRITDAEPGNLRILSRLAHCYEAVEDQAEAGRTYRQIVDTYVHRGVLGKAVEACRKALQLLPHDTSLRERMADILIQRGALQEALQEYQTLLEYMPGDLRINTVISQLRRKLSAAEDNKPAGVTVGASSRAQRPQSMAYADPYGGYGGPPPSEAFVARGDEGMRLFQRKRYNRAIEELTAALNIWKQSPIEGTEPFQYFKALGISYLEMKQPGAAVEVLLQAISSIPECTDAQLMELRYYLAAGYEALGKTEEALRLWKAIYNVDRSYKDVANKILWSRISIKRKS